MATEVPREARRRGILDRGSDRLAFITGQARSLSPSAAAPPPPKRKGAEEGVEEPVSNTRSTYSGSSHRWKPSTAHLQPTSTSTAFSVSPTPLAHPLSPGDAQREVTPVEGQECSLRGKAPASSPSPRNDPPRTAPLNEASPGVGEEGVVPAMYMTLEEIEAVLVASPLALSPPATFLEGLLDEGAPLAEVGPPADIVEVEPPRTVSRGHMPVMVLPPVEASSSSAACASSVGPTGDSVAATYELPKCEPSGATLRDTIDSFGVEILAESKNCDESADAMQHNNEKIDPVTAYGSYSQAVRPEAQQGRRQTDAVQHSDEKIEPVTAYGSHNRAPGVRPEARQGKRQMFGMFTAKKISSSISASENIRILCAVFIALLAVLSYRGYPPGETVGSLISFRPLYLILLTDSSLIFGILFTTNWIEKDGADAKGTGRVGDDWMAQMGKALEVALIFQKVVSAAFLDCCLCAVIIICGVSFP